MTMNQNVWYVANFGISGEIFTLCKLSLTSKIVLVSSTKQFKEILKKSGYAIVKVKKSDCSTTDKEVI